jgi:hypothetical protein
MASQCSLQYAESRQASKNITEESNIKRQQQGVSLGGAAAAMLMSISSTLRVKRPKKEKTKEGLAMCLRPGYQTCEHGARALEHLPSQASRLEAAGC